MNYSKYIPLKMRLTPSFIWKRKGQNDVKQGGLHAVEDRKREFESQTMESLVTFLQSSEIKKLETQIRLIIEEYLNLKQSLSQTQFPSSQSKDLECLLAKKKLLHRVKNFQD